MDTNFRSTRALVGALNALYGASDGGFGDVRIVYQSMRCGGKVEDEELRHAGEPVAPLRMHL
jgi:hypothetical protein